jgi:DNA polymerase elongation subunit (family B)
MRWTQVIQKENPDIIIGYNIFGFDYEFMFRRAEENGCTMDFLMLSRRQGELCANETVTRDGTKIEIEHTKAVFASGEFDLRYFKMSGRIQIDMYSYFRRDFNLSSYKLDDVAGQFISDDISHIESILDEKGDEVTHLYSKNLMGLHVNDFIHIEITGFTSDYYQDGRKFSVLDKSGEYTPLTNTNC